MLDLIEPVTMFPWQIIALILGVAIFSSCLIIYSTYRSVKKLGAATSEMIASINANQEAKAQLLRGGCKLQTLGRGEVSWKQGGVTITFVRYINQGENKENLLSTLAMKLIAIGIDSSDITDVTNFPTKTGPLLSLVKDDMEFSYPIGSSVSIRNPEHILEVIKTALATGFREGSEGRMEITEDDVHDLAGKRAIEDAHGNVATLSQSIGVERENIALIGADLETVEVSNGKIIKLARAHWEALSQAS